MPADIGRAWAPFAVLAVVVVWLIDRSDPVSTLLLGIVVAALALRVLAARIDWVPDVVRLLLDLLLYVGPLVVAVAHRRWWIAAGWAVAFGVKAFETAGAIGRILRDGRLAS